MCCLNIRTEFFILQYDHQSDKYYVQQGANMPISELWFVSIRPNLI